MPKLDHRDSTNPLVWCLAIICTVISVAVIFAGVVVFVGYIVIHPRVPIISVVNANLDLLRYLFVSVLAPINSILEYVSQIYDIAGVLETQITIILRAENDNARAHATFEDTKFGLSFDSKPIAVLKAAMFEVNKNSSLYFHYLVQSYPVPLGPAEMQAMDFALKQDMIMFELKGTSKSRWRVGPLGSVRFSLFLSCNLKFRPSDHTYLPSPCSSSHKH